MKNHENGKKTFYVPGINIMGKGVHEHELNSEPTYKLWRFRNNLISQRNKITEL